MLSENILFYGKSEPPFEPVTLNAGPLSLQFEGDSIRYVRVGDYEILRSVYAALRDHNWDTIIGIVSDVKIDDYGDHFAVSFTSTHQQNDIHFVWHGTIIGTREGIITFEFDGEAKSQFRRNRIGFCILHPMDCAGANLIIEHPNGTSSKGQFPQMIAPHQPFVDVQTVIHEVTPQLHARVAMQGDIFEMEDQRNWSDASYKTYCTPLTLPLPATVHPGDKIWQKITISVEGDIPTQAKSSGGAVFTLQDQSSALPAIGLGTASHDEALTPQQIEWLKYLKLAHLRCDLHLWQTNWPDKLQQAADEASAINASLELAAFVSDDAETELKQLKSQLDALQAPIARMMVFHQNEGSTRAQWLQLAKNIFSVPIGGGTDAFFTEINRERPPVDALDFVAYSLNPQVHAFDNATMVENLAAQAATVATARSFCADKPIAVGPVTLKMRWNPAASESGAETRPDELPAPVDVRQMSLFGAGWALGSIKYLAQSGAQSLTYFETTDWRGIMAGESGSPLPQKFQDIAGAVYPMWHVFAAIAEFGGEVIHSYSNQPLFVDGLALRRDGQLRVLLANYTSTMQQVMLDCFTGDVLVKSMDADSAEDAMRDPMAFRSLTGTVSKLEIKPYAVLQLDGTMKS